MKYIPRLATVLALMLLLSLSMIPAVSAEGVGDSVCYNVTYGGATETRYYTGTSNETVTFEDLESLLGMTFADVACLKISTQFTSPANPFRVAVIVIPADTTMLQLTDWRSTVDGSLQQEFMSVNVSTMSLGVVDITRWFLWDTAADLSPGGGTYFGYPSAVGQAGPMAQQILADVPKMGLMSWREYYDVAVTGTEKVNGKNCLKVEYTLVSNDMDPEDARVGTVVITEWYPVPGDSRNPVIEPIKRVDSMNFAATETQIRCYTPPPFEPPVVATSDATGVDVHSATLNGVLSDMGTSESVEVRFEYGTTTAYGATTSPQTMTSMTPPMDFSADLIDILDANTTYHFRAVADGDGDPEYGEDRTFTTDFVAPTVATNDAAPVTSNKATLNGTLGDMGTAASVQLHFEWGTSDSYGNTTSPQAMNAGGAFSAEISELFAETAYHFRAVADGDGDPVYGVDKTFLTEEGVAPFVITEPVDDPDITAHSAILNGFLEDLGTAEVVKVSFLWGTDPGNLTNETSPVERMSSTGDFEFALTGLGTATTYYYCAKAVGDYTVTDDGEGGVKQFTTLDPVAPMATTLAAGNASETSVRLAGMLDDMGTAIGVNVSFEYGTTTTYGKETPAQGLSAAGPVSQMLYNLVDATTYHFRIKAVGDGTVYGDDMTFKTLDGGGPMITPVYATPTPTPTPTPTQDPTTTPAETTPPATTPAETTPPATTPAETTPPATTPAETTPPATTPAETTPPATTPAETTPPATTPAETTPPATTPTQESTPTPPPVMEEDDDSATNVPLVAGIAVAGAAAAGTLFFVLAGKRRKKKSPPKA